jgi:AraC-like DNA-binding protein
LSFDKQILFFFSALGAFNCTILCIYFFFFTKEKNNSNFFLGGLLAVLSIRIWKSIFFYFNPQLSIIYLQIGLSACFLIGPFLFFYIKSKQNLLNIVYAKSLISVLFFLIVFVGVLFPYQNNLELWRKYIYTIINLQWLVFIVISAFSVKHLFQKIITKSEKISYDEVWILSILCGVSLIWLSYFTAAYTSYISGALSLSFALYLTGMIVFYKKNQTFKLLPNKEKYANKIEIEEVDAIIQKIEIAFNSKNIYKNPNLTLSLLAQEMKIRPQLLSQFINDNLNKSYTQFINEYRIEEAKKLLKENSNLKIEAVAESCGYNSMSAFYSAFKKITGKTPANYTKE